jgi:beta-lactam-binding protein with PASTA domain
VSDALTDVGLTVGKVTTRPDETTEPDMVVACNPPEGTEVAAGSTVDLVVSSGPASSSPPSPTD